MQNEMLKLQLIFVLSKWNLNNGKIERYKELWNVYSTTTVARIWNINFILTSTVFYLCYVHIWMTVFVSMMVAQGVRKATRPPKTNMGACPPKDWAEVHLQCTVYHCMFAYMLTTIHTLVTWPLLSSSTLNEKTRLNQTNEGITTMCACFDYFTEWFRKRT